MYYKLTKHQYGFVSGTLSGWVDDEAPDWDEIATMFNEIFGDGDNMYPGVVMTGDLLREAWMNKIVEARVSSMNATIEGLYDAIWES
ncbi:MAG: hypothetical protein M1824_001126 [Vezdaea acicularis]|nr:MAG: hypothetical protein M1824_001126 [Vezdaea acicularis]